MPDSEVPNMNNIDGNRTLERSGGLLQSAIQKKKDNLKKKTFPISMKYMIIL